MKRTIEVSEKKVIDVNLDQPKYIKFYDAIFYKFVEKDEIIWQHRISIIGAISNPFSYYVQIINDWDAFEAIKENFTVITEQEFNTAFLDACKKYELPDLLTSQEALK